MRIKALTAFMHDSVFIATGTEVDVPESVGIYLIDQKAAEKISGGKGVKEEITPDPTKVTEQATKAVDTLKTVEVKPEVKRKVRSNTESKE